MTALLIFSAFDTASALLNAILIWIVIASAAFTGCLFALIVAGVVTWRAVTRAVTGCWRAAHATPAPDVAETATEPHTPAWAHAEKEAA